MKHFYYFITMLLTSTLSHGQISESFDTGLPTSFQTGSYTLSSGTWEGVSVRNEQNSSRARTGTSAAKLHRNRTPNASITTPILSGAGTVSFWYRKLRTQDASGTISLQWSTDGINYTNLITQSYSALTYSQISFNINSPLNLTIRILNDNDAGRVIIDDFEVTAYTSPPSCSIAEVTSTLAIEDCDNNEYSIEIDISNIGDATFISDGTSTFPAVADVNTVGPYATGTSVTLSVIHSDSACDFTLGNFFVDNCPPSNDNLINAIPISCGNTYTGDTTLATIDEAGAPDISTIEPDSQADNDSPNIWYSFIGTGDPVTLSTCANTSYDSEILIFTGTSGNLTLIDDAYDECNTITYEAETTFTSVLGTRYLISVEGWNVADVGTFELSVICTPPTPVTYTFSNGSWNTDPNGIATSNDNIIIASGNAIINTNTTCNSVTVNPAASLTVSPASTILQVDGTSGLTLESTSDEYSNLISDGSIVGTVNYERHVNSLGVGNDLISLPLMPITGLNFDTFIALGTPTNASKLATNGTFYAFAPYDNATPAYENFTVGATDALIKGKGYRVATNATDVLLTFSGAVERNNISIPISNPTGGSQWNLVGNPYPSYISSSDFLAANTAVLDPAAIAIYGYNANTYTGSGDTVGNFTIINNATNTNLNIAPGQGFLVAANNTTNFIGSVVFNNGSSGTTDMRSLTGNDDFIEGRTPTSYNLKLDLITSQTTQTSFYFNDKSSLGLDPGYDAAVYGTTDNTYPIFSHLVENNEGRAMAIQSLHTSDLSNVTIPLGINANQGELVRFAISNTNLPSTVTVYLEDTEKNTLTSLINSEYVLTPATNLNGTGRFFLRFSGNALSTTESDLETIKVFTKKAPRAIFIQGVLKGATTAQLYDINGRLLNDTALNSSSSLNTINATNFSNGLYILTLNNRQEQKSQKIILR